MLTRLTSLLTILLIACTSDAWSADTQAIHFSGKQTGRTDTFDVDGPWLLDWSIHGKSRLSCNFAIWKDGGVAGQPCNFEIRLVDTDTGEYLGTIAQVEGVGRGHKLFDEPGSFQIDVVAQNVNWEILIKPVDEQMAADLKLITEKGLSLSARTLATSRQVAEGTFSSWRPVDDQTLLLFAKDEATGYRVSFDPPCPGLTDAAALSFVTVFDTGVESYNSILLDDGTRCYFNRVAPTVFD